MARAMVPLEQRMRKADHVHIKGPGTDLNFSIKGIGARACNGLRNIPDGEVFSCPVKDSVNGEISFNTPTIYSGTKFDNVRLCFAKAKLSRRLGQTRNASTKFWTRTSARATSVNSRLDSIHI